MNFHRCDVCSREINERSAGWVTIIVRRYDAPVERDVCCSRCHRVLLNDEWPETKRPAFEEAHAVLDAQRDELAMAGAFDDADPVAVEASLPYTPPVFSGARRNHALASADGQRVLGATS